MKAKRIKKAKRIRSTRNDSKASKKVQVVKDYTDTLIGQTVLLKSLPTNVKKAKRLFEVDKKYKVQKPNGNFVNTLMSVHLKGKDNKIYQIQFMHWVLTAN